MKICMKVVQKLQQTALSMLLLSEATPAQVQTCAFPPAIPITGYFLLETFRNYMTKQTLVLI